MFLHRWKRGAVLLLGIAALTLIDNATAARQEEGQKPLLVRVPNHGIQPQVAVDAKGVVHLVYFKGEPAGGDLFWTTSKDGIQFKDALRVNSQPGSAVA